MRHFTFNGINFKSYFLTNKMTQSLMPPINFDTTKVAGRDGVIPYKSTLGARKISFDVTMITTQALLRARVREVANFLYSDTEKKLIISDEPAISFNAKLSGDTDFEEMYAIGSTTLNFVCADPFGYGATKTVNLVKDVFTGVAIAGTAKTFPVITFKPTGADITGFTLTVTRFGIETSFILTGTFTVGRTYEINMKNGSVIDVGSGVRLMPRVRIDSEFFYLPPTSSPAVKFTTSGTADVTMSYQERYL